MSETSMRVALADLIKAVYAYDEQYTGDVEVTAASSEKRLKDIEGCLVKALKCVRKARHRATLQSDPDDV